MLLLSTIFFSTLLQFGLIFAVLLGCGSKKNGAGGASKPETGTDNKTTEPVKTKATATSAADGTTPFQEDPDLKSRSNYNVKSDGSTVPGAGKSGAPA